MSGRPLPVLGLIVLYPVAEDICGIQINGDSMVNGNELGNMYELFIN